MSLAMTRQERERFLADPHVGIISIAEEGRGPLTVPVWYSYEPGGDLRVVTGRTSRKGRLLERRAGSVCVPRRRHRRTSMSVSRGASSPSSRQISSGIAGRSRAGI